MKQHLLFILLIIPTLSIGQTNLYKSNGVSDFFRWPIYEMGNKLFYLSRSTDSIKNSRAVDVYYISCVDKYSALLIKSVVVLRDTSFNPYDEFQPFAVSYSVNRSSGRLNVLYVDDIETPHNESVLLQYPKTIHFTQLDSNLNVVVASKPVLSFDKISKYAFWVIGFSSTTNSQTTLSYDVRDTLEDVFYNPQSSATKLLTVDDTGAIVHSKFLGWEPVSDVTNFPIHASTDDLYRLSDNQYFAKVDFQDSLFHGQLYSLLELDSNLDLVDTFDFPINYYGANPPGKLVYGLGSLQEGLIFLPTGSLIRSAGGIYKDRSTNVDYRYYGLGKGDPSTGYRSSKIYFPPVTDTDDYWHSGDLGYYGANYNKYDNLVYSFTSTKSDNDFGYCFNDEDNLGQLAAVDTNLNEQWVKYLRPSPGYCVQTFCIAVPDNRKGVIISGVTFKLAGRNENTPLEPFIYYVDRSTRLGVDEPKSHFIISDQFSLFPNPATDAITIQNVLGSRYDYTVYNALGQRLISGTAQGAKNTIDVQSLPAGVYGINIQSPAKEAGHFEVFEELIDCRCRPQPVA